MVGDGDYPHHLLCNALAALGPRRLRPASGGAGQSRRPAVLFLLHRDMAAGVLFRRRPAGDGRHRPVPHHLDGGPGVVRLYLSADRVDRSVPGHRALCRGRPQRPHQARCRPLELSQDRLAQHQDRHLAADRHGDGRRLDLLFRRCANPCLQLLHPERGAGCLFHRRRAHRHHLHLRRLHARAGVHLHVPVAAHPVGHAGRAFAHRHLQRLAWRTARQPARPPRRSFHRLWRLHRLQPVRGGVPARASTSATASNSNASPAPCASMPATR